MSTEAIGAIDANEGRVASAESRLAAAHANDVTLSSGKPGSVQEGHAAVAAAEAALAQAQAALNAARSIQASSPAEPDPAAAPSPASNHLVDQVI